MEFALGLYSIFKREMKLSARPRHAQTQWRRQIIVNAGAEGVLSLTGGAAQ